MTSRSYYAAYQHEADCRLEDPRQIQYVTYVQVTPNLKRICHTRIRKLIFSNKAMGRNLGQKKFADNFRNDRKWKVSTNPVSFGEHQMPNSRHKVIQIDDVIAHLSRLIHRRRVSFSRQRFRRRFLHFLQFRPDKLWNDKKSRVNFLLFQPFDISAPNNYVFYIEKCDFIRTGIKPMFVMRDKIWWFYHSATYFRIRNSQTLDLFWEFKYSIKIFKVSGK